MKFRMVDKVISWAPWRSISGIKAVSFEEYSLKERFPGGAGLPEMLLLESFLQLGNWLVVLSSDFQQMGMVARITEVRFHDSLLPGQRLELEVRLTRRREEGFEFDGEGCAQGRRVISGQGCMASVVTLAEYQSPEDMRVLFSEIYEPAETPTPGAPASLPAVPGPDKAYGKDDVKIAGKDAGAPGLSTPGVNAPCYGAPNDSVPSQRAHSEPGP